MNTVTSTFQYVQRNRIHMLFADEQYLSVLIWMPVQNLDALNTTISVQQFTLVKKQTLAMHKAINHLL